MEADQAIAAVLLAIAVDYQQIVHLEQQHSLTERVWKQGCLLYTSPSPRDRTRSRMPSSA